MTAPDTTAIRAQMEALSGFAPGPWKVSPTDDTTVITHDRNMVAEIDGDYNEPDLWPIMEANARLIAAAPDMRETILALCDALDELRADNERLRAALQPFSEEAGYWISHNYSREDRPVEGFKGYTSVMTCGDLFNARAALAAMETSHDH